MADIVQVEWYEKLVADLRGLAIRQVVRGKHAIGQRILQDELHFEKAKYGNKTVDGLAADLGIDRSDLFRCVQFARMYPELSTAVDNLPWREIRTKLLPSKMGVHHQSDTAEWNSPGDIVSRAAKTLGRIELDPCADDDRSPNVPADQHYTEADDGLAQPWQGRVYMNPPYGKVLPKWIEKLCQEHECDNVPAAIALVPARPDTAWFRQLRQYPRCFIFGRLKFSDHENPAPFPSMAVYLGSDIEKFCKAFADIGDIYELRK